MTRLLILFAVVLQAQDTPQWQPTGRLLNPRPNACIVSLSDGRVLVTGGSSPDGPLNSVEIYNPNDGVFVPFTSMDKPRAGHRCLRLGDDQVLLLGGDSGDSLTASVYIPATDTWTPLADLGPNRSAFSATILDDARILIAGGLASGTQLDTLLFLDPVTFATSAIASTFAVPRSGHTATLLPDGRVIFTGGNSADGPTASVELFDPSSGTFPLHLAMISPRRDHSATLLHDGRLLIAGGFDGRSDLDSTEVFTSGEDTLTALNTRLATARSNHFAILIEQNGSVLLGGGSSGSSPLSSTELFTPDSNSFTTVGALTAPRTNILAALLPDGRVLAIGGTNNDGPSLACGFFIDISLFFFSPLQAPTGTPTFFSSDLVQVTGTFADRSGRLTFSLSRTLNSVTTEVSSRLLTREVALSAEGTFPAAPILRITPGDLGASFLLKATPSRGAAQTLNFLTKFRTTIVAGILPVNPTMVGQPARVAYFLSSDSPNPRIPGILSANLSLGFGIASRTASASPDITGLGTFDVCCPPQSGNFQGKVTYAGTSTHAPVTSSTFRHQVVPNIPTLTVLPPAGGFRLKTPARLVVQISPPAGPVSPPVTGSVQFERPTETVAIIRSSPSSSATLSYTPTFNDLNNGNICPLITYSGDAVYQALPPIQPCFPVAIATTTLTLSTPGNRFAFGQTTTITVNLNFTNQLEPGSATVTLFQQPASPPGASPVPIGLVNLSPPRPGLLTGSVPLVVSTTLIPGTIRAEFAASGVLNSSSAVLNAEMLPISTRISVVPPPSPASSPLSLGARLCTVTPIPVTGLSGSVEFFDGTVLVGLVPVAPGTVIPICSPAQPTDSANITLSGVSRPVGTRQFTARYSGFAVPLSNQVVTVESSTSLPLSVSIVK